MGNKEIPLQQDIFSGEWVDNRTAKEKREAEARTHQMFEDDSTEEEHG